MKTDFRFDKIFLEPFVAHNEDDEGDILLPNSPGLGLEIDWDAIK